MYFFQGPFNRSRSDFIVRLILQLFSGDQDNLILTTQISVQNILFEQKLFDLEIPNTKNTFLCKLFEGSQWYSE